VKNKAAYTLLRTIALIVVLVAAGWSLVMVFRTGQHSRSFLLPILFLLWVASPFAALLTAIRISKPWSTLTCLTLYWLMLLISAGCLLSYSGLLSPPGTKAAFVFIITPLLSWLLIGMGIPIAASVSRRKLNRSGNTGNRPQS
jgi:peptidoglycan/LPS O-acetylase OafA/YrhL